MADVLPFQSPTRTSSHGGRYHGALSLQEVQRAGKRPPAPEQGKRSLLAHDLPWKFSNQAHKEMTPNKHQGLTNTIIYERGAKASFLSKMR